MPAPVALLPIFYAAAVAWALWSLHGPKKASERAIMAGGLAWWSQAYGKGLLIQLERRVLLWGGGVLMGTRLGMMAKDATLIAKFALAAWFGAVIGKEVVVQGSKVFGVSEESIQKYEDVGIIGSILAVPESLATIDELFIQPKLEYLDTKLEEAPLVGDLYVDFKESFIQRQEELTKVDPIQPEPYLPFWNPVGGLHVV